MEIKFKLKRSQDGDIFCNGRMYYCYDAWNDLDLGSDIEDYSLDDEFDEAEMEDVLWVNHDKVYTVDSEPTTKTSFVICVQPDLESYESWLGVTAVPITEDILTLEGRLSSGYVLVTYNSNLPGPAEGVSKCYYGMCSGQIIERFEISDDELYFYLFNDGEYWDWGPFFLSGRTTEYKGTLLYEWTDPDDYLAVYSTTQTPSSLTDFYSFLGQEVTLGEASLPAIWFPDESFLKFDDASFNPKKFIKTLTSLTEELTGIEDPILYRNYIQEQKQYVILHEGDYIPDSGYFNQGDKLETWKLKYTVDMPPIKQYPLEAESNQVPHYAELWASWLYTCNTSGSRMYLTNTESVNEFFGTDFTEDRVWLCTEGSDYRGVFAAVALKGDSIRTGLPGFKLIGYNSTEDIINDFEGAMCGYYGTRVVYKGTADPDYPLGLFTLSLYLYEDPDITYVNIEDTKPLSSRFKGYIYYMEDLSNNLANYDFKNLIFNDGPKYTFSYENKDISVYNPDKDSPYARCARNKVYMTNYSSVVQVEASQITDNDFGAENRVTITCGGGVVRDNRFLGRTWFTSGNSVNGVLFTTLDNLTTPADYSQATTWDRYYEVGVAGRDGEALPLSKLGTMYVTPIANSDFSYSDSQVASAGELKTAAYATSTALNDLNRRIIEMNKTIESLLLEITNLKQ